MPRILLKSLAAALLVLPTLAGAAALKITVANLAYEEKVEEYFHLTAASSDDSFNANRNYAAASSSNRYLEVEGTKVRIDRGEMRRFNADIKGELLKLRTVQLVEAQGYRGGKNNETLFDVIARIKRGEFRGADYVLFGTVSNIDVQDDANPIPGSSSVSLSRNMQLVADFSLINTKTYAVKAAFSAMGAGSDVKLVGVQGAVLNPNNGKIVSEVSKSLGHNVVEQITEQFGALGTMRDSGGNADARQPAYAAPQEEVMVLTPTAPAK